MELNTIITSAVTSAVIMSALIAAGIAILNGHLERKARRQEIYLRYAIDLTKEHQSHYSKLSNKTNKANELKHTLFFVSQYYKWFCKLDKKNALSQKTINTITKGIRILKQ